MGQLDLKVVVDNQDALINVQQVYQAAQQLEQEFGKISRVMMKGMSDGAGGIQKAKSAMVEYTDQIGVTRTVVFSLDKTTGDLSQTTVKVAENYDKMRKALENEAKAAANANKTHRTLGETLSTVATRYLSWGAAINFTVRALREAFTEIKAVDSELTKIKQISGASAQEIKSISDNAYDVASKYGIAAADYLAAVTNFTRAGYANAQGLAETSLKVQLVGDVTEDVASQFLLSADAAWKLRGNVTELNRVLDVATVIDHNYATSIEKLSDAFPVVASTAANANMSVEQTMAALGTITAVTQTSGRNAATALRSIILNIQGQVGTEIEEGWEVTAEGVKSVTDALKLYAPQVLDAAAATGELVNPMEAIAALNEAYKQGLLDDTKLFNILYKLGGKLRTNQLVALVTNYDMYADMLEKAYNATGAADNDIDARLEAINAKVNILKNSWTALINAVIDTGVVKDGLDALIAVVDVLGTLIRQTQEFRATITDAFNSGSHILQWLLNPLKTTLQDITNVLNALDGFVANQSGLEAAYNSYNRAVDQGDAPYLTFEEFVAEYGEGREATDGLTESTQRLTDAQAENADAAEEQASHLNDLYDALTGARTAANDFQNALKDEEKDDVFKSYADAYKKLGEEISAGRINSNAFWASSEFLFGEEVLERMGYDAQLIAENFANTATLFGDADSAGLGLLETMSAIADKTGRIYDDTGHTIATIQSDGDGGWNWWIENTELLAQKLQVSEEAVKSLMSATGVYGDVAFNGTQKVEKKQGDATDAIQDTTSAVEELDGQSLTHLSGQFENLGDTVGNVTSKVVGLRDAIGSLSVGSSMGKSGPALKGHASGTRNAPGGLTLVNERGPELISDNGKAYIAGGGLPTIVNLGKGAIVLTAEETRNAIGAAADGYGGNRVWRDVAVDPYTGDLTQDTLHSVSVSSRSSVFGGVFSRLASTFSGLSGSPTNHTPGGGKGASSNSSGGSGGGGGTSSDDALKAAEDNLKTALSNLDEQIKLAQNQNDHARVLELYREAQDLIADVADQYMAQGYAADSPEVAALLNKGYSYAGNQLKYREGIEGDLWDAFMDAVKDLTDATEKGNAIEEKRLAVEEARTAYENIQKQRTVRIFNPVTGQWEWVADANAVTSAQKKLAEAEKSLQKEQLNQELDALKQGGDLNGLVIGPALGQLLGSKTESELTNLATALQALYGAPQTLGSANANSMFTNSSTDSHDVTYTFPGGISITDTQAQTMTVAQLAQQLRVLGLTV